MVNSKPSAFVSAGLQIGAGHRNGDDARGRGVPIGIQVGDGAERQRRHGLVVRIVWKNAAQAQRSIVSCRGPPAELVGSALPQIHVDDSGSVIHGRDTGASMSRLRGKWRPQDEMRGLVGCRLPRSCRTMRPTVNVGDVPTSSSKPSTLNLMESRPVDAAAFSAVRNGDRETSAHSKSHQH